VSRFFLFAALCVLGAASALAQEYPSKLIRFIVPSTPGSSVDLVGRVLAPEMSRILGQHILVENRPGAANLLAFEYVATQVPNDGYVVAVASTNSLAILPVVVKAMRFDPLKDLPPIIGVGESRLIFGSAVKLPWQDFKQMIAYGKANPGKLNHGASAPISRLPTELVLRTHGIESVYINYPLVGPYTNALRVADIHMGIVSEAQYASLGDSFRVLAVSGEKRYPDLPEVPTFKELGFPQIGGQKFSLHLPAGVPKPVLDKLYAAGSRALALPEVRSRLSKIAIEVAEEDPQAALKSLSDITNLYAGIAKQIGFKAE
jgi:tripartite-type tricarboxylate transporter receptor subunit TctC